MSQTSAKIRMYRLNELGDCFLLTLTAGSDTSRMLIDCGSFRNEKKSIDRIKEIVADIESGLGSKGLDVVVGTHQHNDHVSGFVHCQTEFGRIGIGQVWLSWLDDPADAIAQSIDKDHHNLKSRLSKARDSLTKQLKGKAGARPLASRSLEVLDDILGFYGAHAAGMPPELPAKGIQILKSLGKAQPQFLQPGQTLQMPGLPPGSVKVHVLGPPKEHDLLYRKDPKKGESYDHALAAAGMRAERFLNAVNADGSTDSREEAHFPFASRYKQNPKRGSSALKRVLKRYHARDEAWRTVNDDWLMQAEALALYLDTFTNNSSLVLAIELVASKKVLLFAADAQTGNWLSWDKVKWVDMSVTTEDLLARTVFYKVGHHASHNATLVDAFERMKNPDLVALIPVNKQDSNITKKNGWKMPASKLFKRLQEKTSNRVLQMDDVNPPECDPTKDPARSAWAKIGIKPKVTKQFVEIEISG